MPQVRLYKTQPFATCDTCSRLKQTIQLASGAEQERARGQLERHFGCVERAREAMKVRAAYARAHPDEVLYINIDGMDQAKTNIPNDKVKGKSDDVGAPLTAKLLAAIAYSRGWWGFWSFPDWGASSNLTLTALCKMLRDISGRSPRVSERPAPHASLPPADMGRCGFPMERERERDPFPFPFHARSRSRSCRSWGRSYPL